MPIAIHDKDNPNLVKLIFSEKEETRLASQPIDNIKIRRYMNFNKFKQLIQDKYIWFNRLDNFSDEHEGRAIVDWQNQDFDWLDESRKSVVVNCWNKDTIENFALWNIYLGKEEEGIIIESTIIDFLGSLDKTYRDNIEYYNIEYIPYGEIYDGINYSICATRKYECYSYENELRFIYYQGSGFKDKGLKIKCCTSTLINKIILSPNSSDSFRIKVENLLNANNIHSLPTENSIIKDKLLNQKQ